MNEKKIGVDEALEVWWYFTWRTIIVVVALKIGLGVLLLLLKINSSSVLVLINWGEVIIIVAASVYFVSRAINHNYKNFRLSAISEN